MFILLQISPLWTELPWKKKNSKLCPGYDTVGTHLQYD